MIEFILTSSIRLNGGGFLKGMLPGSRSLTQGLTSVTYFPEEVPRIYPGFAKAPLHLLSPQTQSEIPLYRLNNSSYPGGLTFLTGRGTVSPIQSCKVYPPLHRMLLTVTRSRINKLKEI
ncbi:MAG: hypothetical protein ACFFBD_08575 [Candidatus Hodarchaeota archaeon]